uniref:Ig-like domain-containing protein n=1 Tax=Lepeophtheirus salmonis TaxID=72036 RepID=A0A0K2U8X8_LEPSM
MKTFGLFFILSAHVLISESADLSNPLNRGFYIEDISEHQSIRLGSPFELFCNVTDGGSITENRDWKYCTWTRNRDGHKCKSTYVCKGQLCSIGIGTYSVVTRCDYELQSTEFFGQDPNVSNTLCGIKIQRASQRDEGTWTCSITQCAIRGCDAASDTTVEGTVQVNVF